MTWKLLKDRIFGVKMQEFAIFYATLNLRHLRNEFDFWKVHGIMNT